MAPGVCSADRRVVSRNQERGLGFTDTVDWFNLCFAEREIRKER